MKVVLLLVVEVLEVDVVLLEELVVDVEVSVVLLVLLLVVLVLPCSCRGTGSGRCTT